MDEQTTPVQKKGMSPLVILGIIVVAVILVGGVFLATQKSSHASVKQMVQKTVTPTTVITQSTNAASPTAVMQQTTIAVEGGSFYFKPNTITVKKGEKVKIIFTNAGGIHDLVIDGYNVQTPRIPSGSSATVEFTADKVGTFAFYCSVGNHRQMGMAGTLTVE